MVVLKKKGVSNVVTIILFILLVVAAIALIGSVVLKQTGPVQVGLENAVKNDRISVSPSSVIITADEPNSPIDDQRWVAFTVTRESGDSEIVGLNVFLQGSTGQTQTSVVDVELSLYESRTVSVSYNYSELGRIVSITATPILRTSSGKTLLDSGQTTTKLGGGGGGTTSIPTLFTSSRSFSSPSYIPGVPLGVSIYVQPPANPQIASYVVEETIPNGWSVTFPASSKGRLFPPNLVKFGVFNDGSGEVYPDRTITYTVTPPIGESGAKTFSGAIYGSDYDQAAYVEAVSGSSIINSGVGNKIAGYQKVSIRPGYSMFANQMLKSSMKVGDLFNDPPIGFTVFKRSGIDYVISNYTASGWTNVALSFAPGEGGFALNPSNIAYNSTFIGEVPASASVTMTSRYSIVSAPIPRRAPIQTVLNFPVSNGDTIFRYAKPPVFGYDSTSYDIDFGGWTTGEPSIPLGESFWVLTEQTRIWTITLPSSSLGDIPVNSVNFDSGAQVFRVSFVGVPNTAYRIESSEDLISWAQVGSATSDGTGFLSYTDSNLVDQERFFRAKI